MRTIMISKSKMIDVFGKNDVENCISDKDDWLNKWGANVRHIKGGMRSIYGHHAGESQETIDNIIAA